MTASLLGPGGATGFTETIARQPGTYTYTWPSTAKEGARPTRSAAGAG